MDVYVELDQALKELQRRLQQWTDDGIVVGQTTWREKIPAKSEWPVKLFVDRSAVSDPWSFGFNCWMFDRGWQPLAHARVVLYDGGWADFDWFVPGETYTCECPPIAAVSQFGALLDRIHEILRTCGGGT